MTDTVLSCVRCPIFQGMSQDEHEQVVKLFKTSKYKTGETIIYEGRETQNLWVLISGQCEVRKSHFNGKLQTLDTLDAGSVFGEMSFMSPAPHSASVVAVDDIEVMRLGREQFELLRNECPSAAMKILANTCHILSDRLREMDNWVGKMVEQNSQSNKKAEWRDFRAKLYADWQF